MEQTGNGYQKVVITYDSKKPEGAQITVTGEPDIETMSLTDLQKYHQELRG